MSNIIRPELGPMLIGVFFNMILYGVLIVQTYTYYQLYKSDILWIRYLVIYSFIVETANTAFDMFTMYEPLILRFGSTEETTLFPTFFASEPIVIVAVSTPIQLFFAWRILKLTKSNWIPLIISLLAIVSFAGGCWTGIKIAIVKLFKDKPQLIKPALVWFLPACIADVLITISLVYSLYKHKTGFVASDHVISKIIRMTIQTGMLTSFFAIGDVVFFTALPNATYNFLWDLTLSKLYCNCLMSTLNSRALFSGNVKDSLQTRISEGNIQRQIANSGSPDDNFATFEFGAQRSYNHAASYGRNVELGITVTKVVERMDDPQPLHPHCTQ